MTTEGQSLKFSAIAGVDASNSQYKVVTVNGTIAADNATAMGVLQNKPKAGESATIAYQGHMKAYAGAAIAAGAQVVNTTSGYLITNATSTSGIIGKALTAAASGALVEFLGDFAQVRNSYSIGII